MIKTRHILIPLVENLSDHYLISFWRWSKRNESDLEIITIAFLIPCWFYLTQLGRKRLVEVEANLGPKLLIKIPKKINDLSDKIFDSCSQKYSQRYAWNEMMSTACFFLCPLKKVSYPLLLGSLRNFFFFCCDAKASFIMAQLDTTFLSQGTKLRNLNCSPYINDNKSLLYECSAN